MICSAGFYVSNRSPYKWHTAEDKNYSSSLFNLLNSQSLGNKYVNVKQEVKYSHRKIYRIIFHTIPFLATKEQTGLHISHTQKW